MANLKQYADGSLAVVNDQDGKIVARFGGPRTPTVAIAASYRVPTKAVVSLGQPSAANITGGLLSWANPDGADCVVDQFSVVITSAGIGTADFGTSANVSITSNNLITQLAMTSTGAFDNNTDKGASGKTRQLLTAGQVIVGTSNASAGSLAGVALISYTNL
jgi:hypothetical protein